MTNLSRSLAVLLVALWISATAQAEEPIPTELLQNMRAAYSNLTSYTDSGAVDTTVPMGAQKYVLKKPFIITFKKPDLIKIEWTSSFGSMKEPLVLWSNKKGTFTFNQLLNQVRTETSLQLAIQSWTGVSGGSVQHVPCMLLSATNGHRFTDLTDLKYDQTESIGDTVCHKISGKRRGQPITLLIGQKDSLLRKITVSTPFGDVVEVHENIKPNDKIEDSSISFSPPENAEPVENFNHKKLENSAQQPPSPYAKPEAAE